MKRSGIFLVGVAATLMACGNQTARKSESTKDTAGQVVGSAVPATPADHLVIPGSGIGRLTLRMDMTRVLSMLGKPDVSDGAAGSAWLTWYHPNASAESSSDELNVFSTYADSTMATRSLIQIRVTSGVYTTDLAIKVGAPRDEMERAYPNAKLLDRYVSTTTQDTMTVYDDTKQGISFDVIRDTIAAMTVHPRAKTLKQGYLTGRGGWKAVVSP